jgi:hypothetical protein
MKAYRLSVNEIKYMTRLEKIGAGYSFVRWPEIYWGQPPEETDSKLNEMPPSDEEEDYLGNYRYNPDKEGYIELYKDRILESSEEIAIALDLEFEQTFSDLCFIVLMHELGHWMTHWCHKEEFAHRRLNYREQPKEVKETLAQLFVCWCVKKYSNPTINRIEKIYDWLVKAQPAPYQEVVRFSDFYKNRGTVLRRFSHLLDEKEWGLEYLLDGKKHLTEVQMVRKFIHDPE